MTGLLFKKALSDLFLVILVHFLDEVLVVVGDLFFVAVAR